jgi:tetratricopeptide (TPR) repeat protein
LLDQGEQLEREQNPASVLTYAVFRADLDAVYGAGPKGAVRAVEQALAAHPLEQFAVADRPYLLLANFFSSRGAPEQARKVLEHYAASDSTALGPTRQNLLARGALRLAEGKYAEGLPLMRIANDSSGCPQCSAYAMAEAFELARQPDSALVYWERAVQLPADWERFFDDALSLPRGYQRIGEIYEAKGDRTKALDYYGRLVELWRDAEPSLQPRVTDIKQRIARLVAEQG